MQSDSEIPKPQFQVALRHHERPSSNQVHQGALVEMSEFGVDHFDVALRSIRPFVTTKDADKKIVSLPMVQNHCCLRIERTDAPLYSSRVHSRKLNRSLGSEPH